MTWLDDPATGEGVGIALSTAGPVLMIAALLVRSLYMFWRRTDAVFLRDGTVTGLRWYITTGLHEVRWPDAPALPQGAEVVVYYNTRHPDRWSPTSPYRHTPAMLAVGIVLTLVAALPVW